MNKLSELRQSKKLSQREVANALNISQSTLSQYERGGRGIDGDMLKKLCAFYGASADDILGLPSSQQTASKLSDDAKEFLSLSLQKSHFLPVSFLILLLFGILFHFHEFLQNQIL